MRTIEVRWTKDQVKDWAEWHYRGTKAIGDHEEVVISFDPKHLKGDDWTEIPVKLDIFKKEDIIQDNGA